jgi:protein-S-isoprenylcysteine O-methyltransferase Ste14
VPAFGPRGEGWVLLQFLAIGGVIACGFGGIDWPRAADGYLFLAGVGALAPGSVLFAAGIATLGRSLTPLPHPREDAVLRCQGVYRLVRHPVYGGILLLAIGWSLAAAPLGLLPAAALAVVFDLKSRREEAWLTERFPEYTAYRERTPRRFVPWLI